MGVPSWQMAIIEESPPLTDSVRDVPLPAGLIPDDLDAPLFGGGQDRGGPSGAD